MFGADRALRGLLEELTMPTPYTALYNSTSWLVYHEHGGSGDWAAHHAHQQHLERCLQRSKPRPWWQRLFRRPHA